MSPSDASAQIAALASRQFGNVTLTQLRAAGLSRQEIRTRIDAGWLLPRHQRVYAVGHRPFDSLSRWKAGTMTYGDQARLGFRAAGALFRICLDSGMTEIVLPKSSGQAMRDGIILHRAPLPAHHVTTYMGIPVTNLLRTHLDLATVQSYWELKRTFEEAQVRHGFDPVPLTAEVLTRKGYRGSRQLWAILDGAVDPTGVRSLLELRFLQLCEAQDIPRPLVNERIGKWTADFLWPAAELVVETDGEQYHRTAAKRRRDAKKDEAYKAMGLTIIRLSWRDVTVMPEATAGRVRAALSGAPGAVSVEKWLQANH